MTDTGYGFSSLPAMPWDWIDVTIANPAAGTDLTYTVPNNSLFELINVTFTYTTSAVAATRRVTLRTSPNGFYLVNFSSLQSSFYDHVASTSVSYTWEQGIGFKPEYDNVSNAVFAGTPSKLMLLPGDTVYTSTANQKAADQFSAIKMTFRAYRTYVPLGFT